MQKTKLMVVSFVCFVTAAIKAQTQNNIKAGPVKTEIRKVDSSFQLLRDGKPYFVKGVGGSVYPDRILAAGGNSIRTWGTRDAQKVLDTAHKYGLTVLMGLDVARERHGFNYDNAAAVQNQMEKIRAEVMKYKDHPALLFL